MSALLTTESLPEPHTIPSRGRARALDRLALVVTVMCTVAVCAPFFRYVQWFGDEGIVLNAADKILRGERLYGDFFELLPPASFLIGTAWMKLIGSSLASIRGLAIGVIVAIAALTYVATRMACRSPLLAGLLVGYLLDDYLGTSPWLLIALTAIAFIGAIVRLLYWVKLFAQERDGRRGQKNHYSH